MQQYPIAIDTASGSLAKLPGSLITKQKSITWSQVNWRTMCDLDIPDKAVVLNILHIVEYLDPNGEIYKTDLSVGGDGRDLDIGKQLELIEWARSFAVSPLIAEMVHDYVFGDEDGEEGAAV